MRTKINSINYGNNPNSETEMIMDNLIVRTFLKWINVVKEDISKEDYQKWLAKGKDNLIKDFTDILKGRLNDLLEVVK